MKKLDVIYAGWGERYKLGALADNGRELLFEYSQAAIDRALELSPYKLPLNERAFGGFPQHQLRLPGLISDALPDGWGMLVMDRLFRRQGRSPADVSPLDRLAYIGEKAMGALCFEPAESGTLSPQHVELLELAQSVRLVFENAESEALLLKLVLMGGSPHGARPKALVEYNESTNEIFENGSGRGIPMLVKFPAQHEGKEVCAVEALYCAMADACELQVPRARYFDLDETTSAFGIERFDRHDGMRVPIHTAAGVANVDFRMPSLDYVSLLRLTKFMTQDIREVIRAFDACVFNVIFNNRDDHSKNFSFVLDAEGRWKLSPAYDLTFNEGPNGEHQMDICGEARSPKLSDLLTLAAKTGVKETIALESIDRIATASEHFMTTAKDFAISEATIRQLEKVIHANRERLITTKK